MSAFVHPAKIRTPLPPAALVERPHLWSRIDEGLRRGWVLVYAPAGYGKSALVASWADARKVDAQRLGWLTLEPGDDEPRRLLAHLLAALPEPWTSCRAALSVWLTASGPLDPDAIVATLAEAVARQPELSAVLVLDDIHHLHEPTSTRLVHQLVERLAPALRFVVLTREQPPLPVARARVSGTVCELGSEDLRMSPSEARALMAGLGVESLSDEELRVLDERTQGWPAGLGLAAISARRGGAQAMATLRGSDRHVADYLLQEVLSQLPDELRHFLDATAVLGRLDPGACAAVTERSDAHVILGQLEARSLFITALDRERMWYRYHPLVAELLRWQHRGREDQARGWHAKAARWYEQQDELRRALSHWTEAGEKEEAARVLEALAPAMCDGGELGPLVERLTSLPAAVIASRPRLQVEQAWALFIAGRGSEAEAALSSVEQGLSDADDSTLRGMTAAVRSTLLSIRGDVAGAVGASQRALVLLPAAESRAIHIALSGQGVAHLVDGDLREAEAALTRCVHSIDAGVDPQKALFLTGNLADALQGQARLAEAEAVYRRAAQMADDLRGHLAAMGGFSALGQGDLAYAQGRLDDASAAYDRAAVLGSQWLPDGIPETSVVADVGHATVARARGQWETSARLLEGVMPRLPACSPQVRARVVAAEIALAAAQKQHERVGHLLARSLAGDGGSGGLIEALAFLSHPLWIAAVGALVQLPAESRETVSVSLSLDALPEAIDQRRQRLAAQGRRLALLQVQVVTAVFEARRGRHPAAREAIREALEIGAPGRCLRPIIDVGPAALHLVDAVRSEQAREGRPLAAIPDDYLDALLSAGGSPSTRGRPSAGLSGRERELLVLVAQGQSNREVAEALFISVGTVKRHLNNIFRKLEVKGRAKAVERARAQALI